MALAASEPVRVAVVGGGRMGEIRSAHIARSAAAQLAAFVDMDPVCAANYASRHANCRAYVDLEDMFASQAVDGVWICAPTPTHASLIDTAARNGAHVAVEKPVAMSAGDIRSSYATCRAHGVQLMCAFQRRSDASYAALAEKVAGGAVGEPRSIRAVFRDHPAPPPAFLRDAGSDVFHDLATHDLDFILTLVKQQIAGDRFDHAPDEVWACGTSSTDDLHGVFDAATVVLKWKDAQLCATLDIARNSAYGYDQRLEVFGTNGAYLAVKNVHSTHLDYVDAHGTHQSKLVDSFPQRFDDAYAAELDHFLSCATGHSVPAVTNHDAELATLVAEAARLAARHHTTVKLVKHGNDALHLDY